MITPTRLVLLGPGEPLHIYDKPHPWGRTVCGLAVPRKAIAWYETGIPAEHPAFPFGKVCTSCRDPLAPLVALLH